MGDGIVTRSGTPGRAELRALRTSPPTTYAVRVSRLSVTGLAPRHRAVLAEAFEAELRRLLVPGPGPADDRPAVGPTPVGPTGAVRAGRAAAAAVARRVVEARNASEVIR